jgi:ribosomal-protein-alanine N-acetyltransferase
MPISQLCTPRLRLVPLTGADAGPLHALWTTPGVRRFLWDDQVIPPEQTRDIVEESVRLHAGDGLGLWGARTADGELAGFGGYWYFHEPPVLELLYGVAEPLWGRGFAAEIAKELVRYGFEQLELPVIAASTDRANAASLRVLARLGFRHVRSERRGGSWLEFYELDRGGLAHATER